MLPSSARADEGEALVSVTAGVDAAWLVPPQALAVGGSSLLASLPSLTSLSLDHAAFAALPRLDVGFELGVLEGAALGLRVEGAFAPNLVARGVQLKSAGGLLGALVVGDYAEGALLASAGATLDEGWPVWLGGELEAGPMVAWWSNAALADESKKDAHGLPARLPVNVPDVLAPGALGRARLFVAGRVFEIAVVSLGVSGTAAWAGAPSVRAGVDLGVSFDVAPP